jgi:hypothetical protein
VARLKTTVGPFQVNHFGQLPSVNISFNLSPNLALGDAVNQIQAAAAAAIPATVSLTFQGAAQAFQDSLRGLGLVLLMAIAVIYIVLGVLYESFTHPLTILSGLPAAGLGALLTLLIFGVELNLYAVRRRHHARRAGEKERDHDGGLRGGRPAHGQDRGRGDPLKLPRAFPSDHDDDDGALVGTLPIALADGCRRGVTPPARPWPSSAACWFRSC